MASGPGGAKAVRVVTNLKEGTMSDALTSESMSPGLVRVAERARQEPQAKFHSLAHLIDVDALRRAFHRQRADAAAGVDGITKEQYGQDLEANLQNLYERLRNKR